MTTENQGRPDLELFGQKFYLPNTTIKLAAFVAVLVVAVIIVSMMINNNMVVEQTENGIVFRPVVINDDGGVKAISQKGKVRFWTPSLETKINLDETKLDQYCWQTGECQELAIDSLNALFGDKLLNASLNVVAYSRSEVYGQTKYNGLKRGWWWSASVDGEINDDFLKDFSQLYQEVWLSQIENADWKSVYVEVISYP